MNGYYAEGPHTAALVEAGLLRIAVLHDRVGLVNDLDPVQQERIRGWLQQYG